MVHITVTWNVRNCEPKGSSLLGPRRQFGPSWDRREWIPLEDLAYNNRTVFFVLGTAFSGCGLPALELDAIPAI